MSALAAPAFQTSYGRGHGSHSLCYLCLSQSRLSPSTEEVIEESKFLSESVVLRFGFRTPQHFLYHLFVAQHLPAEDLHYSI